MRLSKVFQLVLFVAIAGGCGIASARYVQPDPEGLFPTPEVPKPAAAAVPDTAPAPKLPRVRVITADEVLAMHGLNHSYAYVDSNPLSYIDPEGTQVNGFTKHGINQVINRNISPSAIQDAMTNPSSIVVRIGPSGVSARYIGSACVVVINPVGDVITAWPR